MVIIDFFKKKKIKEEKEKKEVRPEEKPKEVISEVKPPIVRKDYNPPTTLPSRHTRWAPKIIGEAYKILKTPHVTEKATDLVKKNQYVFKVYSGANKMEIKKTIEDLYGVNVVSVKTINIPRKKRKLGRISGWRKGYKKAIVKIKEGQKIEVLPR